MKLRKFFMFLLVLTLTLGVCAACGDKEEPTPDGTYTVSFYDGETKVSSVEVEAGNALAESDIPAAPTGHQGEVFLGWFIGETKVEAGYKPTASVTAKANFRAASAEKYTVTVTQSNDFIVNGIKSEYSEGENVSFTISVTNTSKQLDEVTSADVTITSSNGGFSFTMPAKNVTVTVTLKAADPQGGEGPNEPEEEVDERIQLFMKGDLYLHHSRTIYATLSGGLSGDLEWSSDDINVVSIGSSEKAVLQGDMPEALLHANATGTATIRCALKNNIKIFNEYEITVRDASTGTSMPEDLYQQLTGSIKLTSTEQLLDYDVNYTETVSETHDIKTIFEENNDTQITIGSGVETANLTDAYQIEVKDHTTGVVSFEKKYVTDQRNVCIEYIGTDNTVHKKAVISTDTDGDTYSSSWAKSSYTNIFHARPTYSSPDLWKSFDGGHTYYYVGSDNTAPYICLFLYGIDVSPDDMYFEVEGNEIVKLTVVIDPANYQNSKKFGRKIETTFSEFGTATIEHLEPFATESYHTGLKTALQAMAALKNYKAVASFDGNTYEITYLADTIDVVMKDGTGKIIRHTGVHKYGEGEGDGDGKTYYEYTYDDDTKTLTKGDEHDTPWEDENIARYPTFNFAAEIFGQAAQDKTFVSRINNGEFIKETFWFKEISDAYGIWDFSEDGTLKLDSSGNYIQEVSTTVKILDEEDPVSIVFSAYNEATVDIQFTEVITPAEPTTWEEGLGETLYAKAGQWHFPLDKLPYVHTEIGFYGIDGYSYRNNWIETAATIRTNVFNTTDERDAYIAQYKAALEAAGWTVTTYTMPENFEDKATNYTFYQKDGVDFKVAVGWYNGGYKTENNKAHIAVFDCDEITRQSL